MVKRREAELSLETQDEEPSLREIEDLGMRLEEQEWRQRQGGDSKGQW